MKRCLTFFMLAILGCSEPKPDMVCGVNDPTNDLPWLKEIITKAEEDKTTMAHKGNYLGWIYLDRLRGQPVFIVRMAMGSGGLAMYLFRCDGQRVYPTSEESTAFGNLETKRVLYSNVP